MKLPIIQSLWIGSRLSQVEKLCIKSFMDHGHEFHLYTYGNIEGAPQGTTIKDANEILPQSLVYKNKKGSFAEFSNWFRYLMLVRNGNFWVDMDVICMKPFVFDSDVVVGWEETKHLCNAVLSFPRGHPLMEALENEARNHTEACPWDEPTDRRRKLVWKLTGRTKEGRRYNSIAGTRSLSLAIQHFGLTDRVKPFMYFYPIPINHWSLVFDGSFAEGTELYKNTYSIHLWNVALNGKPGFDKDAIFDEQSLFEQLKKKHGIEQIPNAPVINKEKMDQYANSLELIKRRKKQKRTALTVALAVFVIGWMAGYVIASL